MKPFADLTDAEILALTEEQITYYIDLACAEQGVRLLPPSPPAAPSKPAPDPDVKTFKVGGLLFATMEDAERVRDAINSTTSRLKADSTGWYPKARYFVVPDTEPVEVTNERHMSAARSAAVGDEVVAHKEAEEKYAAEKRTYDDLVTKRQDIVDGIRLRRRQVRREDERRQELARQFVRYTELAEGNRVIAARFLAKAHADARELLPELFTDPASIPETPAAAAVGDDDIPI